MAAYPKPVLLHIPHDSPRLPPALRGQFLLDAAALRTEQVRMTDHRTLELFARGVPAAQVVAARVSRLVVDVERFADDALEPMARHGLGVVYQRTAAGAPLRRPLAPEEREALLAEHYHPHHQRLRAAVDAALAAHGRCLIVDGRSFPALPLPFEADQSPDRPDICIGTDPFHTPEPVAAAVLQAFGAAGFTLARDRPFAGALVPLAHYRQDPRVLSVMVEVNRRLYLDEATGLALAGFEGFARRIRRICRLACARALGLEAPTGPSG